MCDQSTIFTLVKMILAEEEQAGRTYSVVKDDDKWHLLQGRKFPGPDEYHQRVLDYLRRNWTPASKEVADYMDDFRGAIRMVRRHKVAGRVLIVRGLVILENATRVTA